MENNLNERGLGTVKLTFFSIGTTLASGVFSMVGDLAASGAYTGATLIGWLVCGLGTLALCLCFYQLGVKRPDLQSGIFAYARDGFGEYIGFNVAWGYLLSAALTPVAFMALLFTTLSKFFPVFGSGSNFVSCLTASIILWLLCLLVARGVKEAVTVNMIAVIAKIIPILVMILAVLFARAFKWSIFIANFWGPDAAGSVLSQVKGTMFTTVWIFIGIEGAVVLSTRAKTTKVAGRAAVWSFLGLLALYMVIDIMGMGIMPHDQLAALATPSMSSLVEYVVGPWGAVLVSVAIILSLIVAMFSYTILVTDSACLPAKQGCFPKFLAQENSNGGPAHAAIVAACIFQFFIILVYVNDSSFQILYTLSTSLIMIPYISSAVFMLVQTAKGVTTKESTGGGAFGIWIISLLGTVYGAWMLYASGWQYILIMALAYTPGAILYFINQKQKGEKMFPKAYDFVVFIIMVVWFIAAVVCLVTGKIAPF